MAGDGTLVIELRHANNAAADIIYRGGSGAGMLWWAGGAEEYYGDYGEDGPLERVLVSDLTERLGATWQVEETFWRGKRVRRVVREAGSIYVSGWLLPPRWFIPRRRLQVTTRTTSFGSLPESFG